MVLSRRWRRIATAGALAAPCLLAFALLAPAVQAQSLTEALAAAYRGNPKLDAARAGLRATSESLPQAQSQIWRPTITLTGEVTKTYTNLSDRETASIGSQSSRDSESAVEQQYEYQVDLPVYDAAAIAGIRRARADIAVGVAELLSSEQEILESVVEAYADVVRYRAEVALREQEVGDLRALVDQSQRMLEAQRRTVTDLAQARDALASALGELADTRGELRAAESSFRALVGSAPAALDGDPALPGLPATLEEALGQAEALRPGVLSAKQQIRSDEAQVDERLGAILPTVTLFHTGTHLRDDTRYTGLAQPYEQVDQENVFEFGLEVSIALFQGGLVQAQVREAKQTLSQARLELVQAQRELVDDVSAAWARLEAAREALAYNQERLAAAIDAENGAAYQLGRDLISVQDYLTTHDRRIEAEVALADTQARVLTSSAVLLSAAGLLTAARQGLPVALYDPEDYLRAVDGKWLGFGE